MGGAGGVSAAALTPGGGVAARRRASEATASATARGSSGCGTAASARDQAASQASCGRPVSTSTGRAVVDLVVQLPAHAEPAGRGGLPVEDEDVEAAGVDRAQQGRQGRELADLHQRQVGGGAAADGAAHLLAGRRLVAVQRHGQAAAVVARRARGGAGAVLGGGGGGGPGLGGSCAHGRESTGPAARCWCETPGPPLARARRGGGRPTPARRAGGWSLLLPCPPIRLTPWQQQRQSARAHRRW